MSPVSRLLRIFGYVRLRDYGYMLLGNGRIVSIAEPVDLQELTTDWQLEPYPQLSPAPAPASFAAATLAQLAAPPPQAAPTAPAPFSVEAVLGARPARPPLPRAAVEPIPELDASVLRPGTAGEADAGAAEGEESEEEWEWRMAMARAAAETAAEPPAAEPAKVAAEPAKVAAEPAEPPAAEPPAAAPAPTPAAEVPATAPVLCSPPAAAPDLEAALRSIIPPGQEPPPAPPLEVAATFAGLLAPAEPEAPARADVHAEVTRTGDDDVDDEWAWETAMAEARKAKTEEVPRERTRVTAAPARPREPSVPLARRSETSYSRNTLSGIRARASEPTPPTSTRPLSPADRSQIRAAATTLTRQSVLPPRDKRKADEPRAPGADGSARLARGTQTNERPRPGTARGMGPVRDLFEDATREIDRGDITSVATRVEAEPDNVVDIRSGLPETTEHTLVGDAPEAGVDTAVLALPQRGAAAPLPRLSDRLRR